MDLGLFKTETFHPDGLRPICTKTLMDLGLFKIKYVFYQRFVINFQDFLTSKPIHQTHQTKASDPEIQKNQNSQFS